PGALPDRGPPAEAERGRVRRAVLRVEGQGRAVLLGSANTILDAPDCLPMPPSVVLDCRRIREGVLDAGDGQVIQEVLSWWSGSTRWTPRTVPSCGTSTS